MPAALTTASSVRCGHPNGLVVTTSGAKLRVEGSSVLPVESIVGAAIGGCTVDTPCTAVTAASGAAGKLTAGGRPVMLATLTGPTTGVVSGTPQALLCATPNQGRLLAA